ncbi:zinc finger BED domain-containing protein RICESLEEPER 2-like [Lotus japonicus]|uniref:zinc finger BED domain-containing protein RICESLEEPER 2-like n=1 Tax=Lotus japonicus TaxID=34305 RepID=UPI00258475D5|nr:zinc finger BED domain-containing protein RICESLEEPER 2-like [Lotus japonicus]XP_057422230.1 zinc finger BED domain-containing protein RICESLEEPER 2-like [Lotus japonicus]
MVSANSSQLEDDLQGSENDEDRVNSDLVIKRKRQKTSAVLDDFDEVVQFQPSNSSNPFVSCDGVRYCNGKMREIIATAVMVHELPFSIVEDEVWMWAFQYANSSFQKVTSETVRSDCLSIYEAEKKKLKTLLTSVNKISLTIDMWKSSHQVDEYMVISGHFVDAGWKLQKRVLSCVKVPSPRCGIDVAGAIFKCLKAWRIENKVFSVSVDNDTYNDSCLANLKEKLSLSSKVFLGGALFHVRSYLHVLNSLVQDGLSKIEDIIFNIRESMEYINYNDARLKTFCDVVEQKRLGVRKLLIDCPTRWNTTFHMLTAALKFKIAFAAYKEREPHYDYAPSLEDWDKVEKVCTLLEVFNSSTHVVSGCEYPTASLCLAKVLRVKQLIDNAAKDGDLFMREMVAPMKVKFDKYLGECSLLLGVASILDPRCKYHIVDICFPLIYESEEVAKENIKKVRSSLEELYDEYVSLSLEGSSSAEANNGVNNPTSSTKPRSSFITGFDHLMSILHEKEVVPPVKSELQAYLDGCVYVPDVDNNSFSVLEWWRNNNSKYKILSKLAIDILAVPISTMSLEDTFSARGRVIGEMCSRSNEESIEALICGGDWLRHKYNIKRKSKVDEGQEEIMLKV